MHDQIITIAKIGKKKYCLTTDEHHSDRENVFELLSDLTHVNREEEVEIIGQIMNNNPDYDAVLINIDESETIMDYGFGSHSDLISIFNDMMDESYGDPIAAQRTRSIGFSWGGPVLAQTPAQSVLEYFNILWDENEVVKSLEEYDGAKAFILPRSDEEWITVVAPILEGTPMMIEEDLNNKILNH